MNKLVIFMTLFTILISATEKSEKPALTTFYDYANLPIDTKLIIFNEIINDTSTIPQLNVAIKNFALVNKANLTLVKTDNRFKTAIKKRQQEIQQPLLLEAQKIFDNYTKSLEGLYGIGKLDLLKDGPNARDAETQEPALTIAVGQLSNPKLVTFLLQAGANPNILHQESPPLFYLFPSKYGYHWNLMSKANQDTTFDILKLLVEAGADVNMLNGQNETILDKAYSVQESNSLRVKYIKHHDAKTAWELKEK